MANLLEKMLQGGSHSWSRTKSHLDVTKSNFSDQDPINVDQVIKKWKIFLRLFLEGYPLNITN